MEQKLTLKLGMQLGQTVVMTPQLQQAVKLLQMTTQELQTFVYQEVEKNPLLELQNPDESFSHFSSGTPGSSFGEKTSDDFLNQICSPDVELIDFLMEQIAIEFTDLRQKAFALKFIEFLDDSGYLSDSLENISVALGLSHDEANSILKRLQCFEPTGIFARNLSECLAIQLVERNHYDPLAAKLLAHLDLFLSVDPEKIMKTLKITKDDFVDIMREIKRLNPKPGASFKMQDADNHAISPDVLIYKDPSGSWAVDVNRSTLPTVYLNKDYYKELKDCLKKQDDRHYLSQQYYSAQWLKKAIDHRNQTLLLVAIHIAKAQEDFLKYGMAHLHPLSLKKIAQATGMHESTISRIINGKFVATPRGTFELKYFFKSAISQETFDDAMSSESVRFLIKSMIAKETATSVLSDEQIALALAQKNIVVARRTVAKYRDSLGIPSAFDRRRQYLLNEKLHG